MTTSNALYVIDLARCTGCHACAIACKDRADLPDDLDWLRIEAREAGAFPNLTLAFRVVHCFHCEQAPCMTVCPAGAIARDDLGLVQVDGSACVRCGACGEVCPFGAIQLPVQGPATKCDGCTDELRLGWEPTCVRACPMRALAYGTPSEALPARRARDDRFDDQSIGPAVRYLRWRESR